MGMARGHLYLRLGFNLNVGHITLLLLPKNGDPQGFRYQIDIEPVRPNLTHLQAPQQH